VSMGAVSMDEVVDDIPTSIANRVSRGTLSRRSRERYSRVLGTYGR
jgi:hypothetical protein